jgi:hypothetical protein
MALGRLRSIDLRYYAPGEWGKLLGLDRAPEVRTLRIKLKHLADQEQAFCWSSTLCKEWMLEAPEEAAVLYADGHVRVYHGTAKVLPKHYVARERRCLSATADYWVNAMDGKPFFVVSQAVHPGLLQVLERDIVPRLEADLPNQPGADELDADPLLHRFTVVFDREGYSPEFFAKMKKRGIACLTYHKYRARIGQAMSSSQPRYTWPRGSRARSGLPSAAPTHVLEEPVHHCPQSHRHYGLVEQVIASRARLLEPFWHCVTADQQS